MIDVVIIGGEGDGGNIGDFLQFSKTQDGKQLNFIGFLNDRVPIGHEIDGYEVIGTLEDAAKFKNKGIKFISVLLRVNGMRERYNRIKNLGIFEDDFTEAIHESAYVAKSADIGKGAVIYPGATILSNSAISQNCLVLAQASIGHHTVVKGYNKIGPGSIIGSNVNIGLGVQIGLNSTILDNLQLGQFSVLGGGSLLTKNLPDGQIWVGSPAKYLREII